MHEQLSTARLWSGRTADGRFAPGHQFASLGWQGLVQRRFGGDEHTAKLWFSQLGRWAYAKSFVGNQTSMMAMRFATVYAHPGKPEQYRKRLDFSLADVPEMEF